MVEEKTLTLEGLPSKPDGMSVWQWIKALIIPRFVTGIEKLLPGETGAE